MPKILLDTDILSVLLRQQATVVNSATQYLLLYPQCTFSLITRYEILRGLKAKNAQRQWMTFDVFCQNSEIVPVTEAIISRASDIYADLYKCG